MRSPALLLTLLSSLLVALLAPGGAAATSVGNPVLPQTASGDDSPDPWIFRHDGRYWITYTTTGHLEVRSAATLAGLADAAPRRLWPRAGQAEPAERSAQLWAPEIHRLKRPDGQRRWYVYYAANAPGELSDHRMYVLESEGESPAGPYRFKARLQLPHPYAIDGTVAEVGGRHYLIYSGGASFAPASLQLVPLSDPWTVSGAPVEISQPSLPWERVSFPINEGPEVLRRGGTLNVVYSASWCGTGSYALGLLSVPASANLLDQATWQAAKRPDPVFSADRGRAVFGPGHGSFFSSPDGRESWMVYHATETDNGCFTGGLRTTRAQRFTWNADGTPRFGAPVALDRDLAAPGGDGTIAVQAERAVRGARAAARVTDRRLVGYTGLAVRPSGARRTLPPLRVTVPRAGRYAVSLRLLGGPEAGSVTLARPGAGPVTRSARRPRAQAVALSLGTVTLRRGATVLTLRATAPLTLDQLRLEPR